MDLDKILDWKIYEQKESEDNWGKRDKIMRILQRKTVVLDRIQIEYICQSAISLRTQLQLNALAALKKVLIEQKLDAYNELILTHMFKIISFTKKLPMNEAMNIAHSVMENMIPNNRILTLLTNYSLEKNVEVRTSAVVFLTIFYQQALETNWLEKNNLLEQFANTITKLNQDASSNVRDKAKLLSRLFETFNPEFRAGGTIVKKDLVRKSAPVTPIISRLPVLSNVESSSNTLRYVPVKRNSTPVILPSLLPALPVAPAKSGIPSYSDMRRNIVAKPTPRF